MTASPIRPDKHAILAAHPLFKGLGPQIIQRLVAYSVVRKVKAGTTIFRKGDAGTVLYAICSGTVRINVPSEEGKGAMLNTIGPGQLFGEIALLDGGPRTADAGAAEESELMTIERRDFVSLMRDHPDLALKVIELLCSRLRKTSEQVEDLVFMGLPGRLAKALLRLSETSTKTRGESKIAVTQREISQMIGASREITNRQLREWQAQKWVRLERGRVIVLSAEALARIASTEPHGGA